MVQQPIMITRCNQFIENPLITNLNSEEEEEKEYAELKENNTSDCY